MEKDRISFLTLALAKKLIGELGDVTEWLGVTTTPLEDGSTTNPITIDGETVTAESGDFVQYGSSIFALNKNGIWQKTSLNVTIENGCLTFA